MTPDRIDVKANGILEVRAVLEDGQYFRYTLAPGADLEGQPAEVVAAAADAWTPDVIAAYEASNPEGS